MEAKDFLARKSTTLEPLYVVVGDEDFLKRLVMRRLRDLALGDDLDDTAVSTYPGIGTEFATVWDELISLPFFAPKRYIIVENADTSVKNATPFLSKYRALLEDKITAGSLPATGLLILDVKSWPKTTRLAKMVDSDCVINCTAPQSFKLPQWACEWAASQHQKQLALPAAQLLVELVGGEMGLLDQEIIKLSTYVGDNPKITAEDVDRLVGNNRTETTFKIFDLIGQGQTAAALRFLQRQLEQGEEPWLIVGAFGKQLRSLAKAARMNVAQGGSLGTSLANAGIPPFALKSAEAQLKHLSRKRAFKLYDWLLELNMDLRGNSPLPPTAILERFILRLAAKA